MPEIFLSTLNARYIHTAIGLRYLQANLDELSEKTAIMEFTLTDQTFEIAEKLLCSSPRIIGLGVYIWNAVEVQRLVQVLKKIAPDVIIVLGGPEVSHLPFRQDFSAADYIIRGEGEIVFLKLCRQILESREMPRERIQGPCIPDLATLKMPYYLYSDEDVANRIIYVEASRGCPFSCEFCLSSIDKQVRYFDTDLFLVELEALWDKGARQIKFMDRTFNLNLTLVHRILNFFLAKEPPYLVHFEVIPDHFPTALKDKLRQFPPGVLQLEVGIQTLDQKTAENISRNLNLEKITENLGFLDQETNAHLHIDLILGLPGETVEDFGRNLNQLTALAHGEIQLGVLKKLSGTSITRHDQQYQMLYAEVPPYEILQNQLIPFAQMQEMKRFTRFWDLVYNSGNFPQSAPLIWSEGDVYREFLDFSRWVYRATRATWQISLKRLSELLFTYLVEEKKLAPEITAESIARDVLSVRGRALPELIRQHTDYQATGKQKSVKTLAKRQVKHQSTDG